MASIRLEEISLPDFGTPRTYPQLSREIYRRRLNALRSRMRDAGLDALVVYADREHFANLAYLTGFDPRFEEAVMIVVDQHDPVILTGPENQGCAAASLIDVEVRLFPPFGLLGQDRSKTRPMADLFAEAGVKRGAKVGIAGWKYFGPEESNDPASWIEAPAFVVDVLRGLVGETGQVSNATAIFMRCTDGLRASNEIDQLAQFEFAATHGSEGIKRVLFGLDAAMTEFEVAQLMRPIQMPLNCHPMLSSGRRAYLGLGSPSSRTIERGDPITCALGLWGSLTCRAGWVAKSADDLPLDVQDYVERLAGPYYMTAVEWYEGIGIGTSGGHIDALVKARLGEPFFNLILNHGHLIHYDEWLNTPIYPGSTETFRSGQAVQLDIIPATGSAYFTSNIEDGVALLDADGRAAFADRHPEAWRRIEARRAFMGDVLGIRLKAEVLPLSNLAGYLAPFMLSPDLALVRR